MPDSESKSVAVIGAGVAGIGAAFALSQSGYQVHLLDRRPYPGGRASSYLHPALNEVVDCQHVLVGCCTNLIDLFQRSSVADSIRWYDQITFLEATGRASTFRTGLLPAPLHYTESFLRAPMLGLRDKLGIARAMTTLLSGIPADDHEGLDAWLRRLGQTDCARRHFWEPIVVCTLNDNLQNCSARHAAHVFRELFIRSATGGHLGIPTIPLSDLHSAPVRVIQSSGGSVCYRASVEQIQPCANRWRLLGPSVDLIADAIVLAVPFEQMQRLLPTLPANPAATALSQALGRFVPSSYTTVHLWFDREITSLDHAALLDTDLQWIFNKSRIRALPSELDSYVELVIAGSPTYLAMDRQQILARSIENLALYFPEVKSARLVRSGILKEARATFSVLPDLDSSRPSAPSPWPGIFLAGDWTSTGWPSTMEGALRSGYLAASAVTAGWGAPRHFFAPELPASGFMRLFRCM